MNVVILHPNTSLAQYASQLSLSLSLSVVSQFASSFASFGNCGCGNLLFGNCTLSFCHCLARSELESADGVSDGIVGSVQKLFRLSRRLLLGAWVWKLTSFLFFFLFFRNFRPHRPRSSEFGTDPGSSSLFSLAFGSVSASKMFIMLHLEND